MTRNIISRQRTLSDSNGPIVTRDGDGLHSERSLVAVAIALGARGVAGWSQAEESLATDAEQVSTAIVVETRERIEVGEDPLGEAFCRLRLPAERRTKGATFTPRTIIDAMVEWAATSASPTRIVDPGTGSGRYLVTAGRRRVPRADSLPVFSLTPARRFAAPKFIAAGLKLGCFPSLFGHFSTRPKWPSISRL